MKRVSACMSVLLFLGLLAFAPASPAAEPVKLNFLMRCFLR
jgi:hypothetical protein